MEVTQRLIGTMMGKVHLLPGTTYSNVRAKGDADPEKTAAMTTKSWSGARPCCVWGVSPYRASRPQHHPLAAWQRGILGDAKTPGCGEPPSVPDTRRFLIDFLPLERRLVRRDGVSSTAFTIGPMCCAHGSRAAEDDCSVRSERFEPDLPSRIRTGSTTTRVIATFATPITLWEHRLAGKQLRD